MMNDLNVVINSNSVDEQIKKGVPYEEKQHSKEIMIEKLSTNEEDEEKYYKMYVKNNTAFYKGIASKKFQRNGFGVNKFPNGDVYIGNWVNGDKKGLGLEIYKKGDSTQNFFIGRWEKNQREVGLYFWGSLNKEHNVSSNKFECFFGQFQSDKYHNGLYIVKNDKSFLFYKGKFEKGPNSDQLTKNDKNGIFYHNNRVFEGEFSYDHLENGIVYFISESKACRGSFQGGNFSAEEMLSIEKGQHRERMEELKELVERIRKIDFDMIVKLGNELIKRPVESDFASEDVEKLNDSLKEFQL